MTFFDWLKKWLRVYEKPSVKNSTLSRYETVVRLQIAPALGEVRIEELTVAMLQNFAAEMSAKYSVGTVKLIYYVVNHSLARAAEEGLIEPIKLMHCPKTHEKRVECFSVSEQKKIEEYVLSSDIKKLRGVVLCLYTGLRIGELMALEWSDIDFVRGYMTVTKTCRDAWRDGVYKKVLDTPKSDSSCRTIPLPPQILIMLRQMRKDSVGEFVICGNGGKAISCRSYQSTFDRMLKRLDIPHKGFHSLRHTFATRAVECGMDIRTLAELMGHSDPTITLRRYAHSMLEHKAEMMNRLGKLLS